MLFVTGPQFSFKQTFTAGHFAVSDMRCTCASACRHVIRLGARHTSCGRTACAKAFNESTHSSTPGIGQISADSSPVVGVICLTGNLYFLTSNCDSNNNNGNSKKKLLPRPFPNLGSVYRVFVLHDLRSCASSLYSSYFSIILCIAINTSVWVFLPFGIHSLPSSHYYILLCLSLHVS